MSPEFRELITRIFTWLRRQFILSLCNFRCKSVFLYWLSQSCFPVLGQKYKNRKNDTRITNELKSEVKIILVTRKVSKVVKLIELREFEQLLLVVIFFSVSQRKQVGPLLLSNLPIGTSHANSTYIVISAKLTNDGFQQLLRIFFFFRKILL